MYLEFFLLIFDYFKTLTLRITLYEIVIPILISGFSIYILHKGIDTSICKEFAENSLTLLGILLGFSITIITILTTGNSRNLLAIQKTETSFVIGENKITLFDLLLINFTYSVVVEIIMIIGLLLIPMLLANISISHSLKVIGFSLLVGIVIHVLLLTMRNLTDFYLILLNKTADSN